MEGEEEVVGEGEVGGEEAGQRCREEVEMKRLTTHRRLLPLQNLRKGNLIRVTAGSTSAAEGAQGGEGEATYEAEGKGRMQTMQGGPSQGAADKAIILPNRLRLGSAPSGLGTSPAHAGEKLSSALSVHTRPGCVGGGGREEAFISPAVVGTASWVGALIFILTPFPFLLDPRINQ